ncbi:MAG TPA: GH1 family beta-glucosidase, partial [Limnochordia bacterium]
FPPDFLWGVATSAYQIEGYPLADGAGPNIWHRFSRLPGRTIDAATGDIACDHYHRYREDVALMDQLGIGAYRFSIAWGRILPEGRRTINPKGIGFYDRLLDEVLSYSIVPFVTLYHWDLPLALEDRGGWLNDDIAGWFSDYADLIFRTFGDRVPYWVTINEPAVITEKGYVLGVYAPGHRNPAEAPAVARNLLRAHGRAVQACRASTKGKVGIALNLQPKHAATNHPDDVAAMRRADAFRNRQFIEPILKGHSPQELEEMFGDAWRPISQEDMAAVHSPIDFMGINYYTRGIVRNDPSTLPTRAEPVEAEGRTHTLMGWEVYPEGLTEALLWVKQHYGDIPLYVTENGVAFEDPVSADGEIVNDPARIDFLRAHLQAAMRARMAGADLRGYFLWSLLDNFEWSSGYVRPFGIVQVDFHTQRRTLKASAKYYADVIRSAGAGLLDG